MTRSFDAFFDGAWINGWVFETPSCSLWRQCNDFFCTNLDWNSMTMTCAIHRHCHLNITIYLCCPLIEVAPKRQQAMVSLGTTFSFYIRLDYIYLFSRWICLVIYRGINFNKSQGSWLSFHLHLICHFVICYHYLYYFLSNICVSFIMKI